MILSAALMCLALNVYHESRGEPLAGQIAVASVTMNRAEGQKGKVCEVVMQPKQFSWTNRLVVRQPHGWRVKRQAMPQDDEAWQRSLAVASVALSGKMPDVTNGATFYHTRKVAPLWRRALVKTVAIGGHIFYRQQA